MVVGVPKTGKKAANYILVSQLVGEQKTNPALLADPVAAVWVGLGLYLPVPDSIKKNPKAFFATLRLWREAGYPETVVSKLSSVYAFPRWQQWTTPKRLAALEKELLSVSGFEFFAPHETITAELVVEFLWQFCQQTSGAAFISEKEVDIFYAWLHLCGKRPTVHSEIFPGKVFSGDILGRAVADDCRWSKALLSPAKHKSAFPPADMYRELERLSWEGREKKLIWRAGTRLTFNNTTVARTQECPSFPGVCIFQTRNREWEVAHTPTARLLHAGEPFSSRDKAISFIWLYLSILGNDFLARNTGYNRIERAQAYWLGDVLRAFVD